MTFGGQAVCDEFRLCVEENRLCGFCRFPPFIDRFPRILRIEKSNSVAVSKIHIIRLPPPSARAACAAGGKEPLAYQTVTLFPLKLVKVNPV